MHKKESRKFIETVERIMVRWGYTHSDGKIYGHLLLSESPLTISELAELTGLSRSSVSTSLNRLSRDYLVTVRKNGKTKLFTAIPSFLEKFLRQPKETLEKEVRPLKKLTERLIEDTKSGEHKLKLQEILSDLKALECILSKIIEMEEMKVECLEK